MSQPQLQVCRTCLQVIDNQKYCVNLDASDTNPTAFEIKSKLEACVPELTLGVVKNPIVCANCITSLNKAYTFKRRCLETEEKIYEYMFDCDDEEVDIQSILDVLKHKDNVMEQQDENTLSETDEKDDSLNCSAQTDDNTCEKIVDVVKGKDNVAELQEEKTPNETNEKDVSLNCSAQTDDNTCEKIVDNEAELQDEKMLSETDEKDVSLNCSAQTDDNTCEKMVDNEAELQDEKPLIETDEEDVFSECSADTNDNTYENTSNVLDSKENVSLSLPSCYVVLTPLSVDWVGSYSLDDNTKNKSKQNVACTDSPKEHKHLNNKVGAENEQQQKVNPKKYYCNICEKGIKHSDIAKHSLYHKKVKKERIIFICLPFNEKTANPMQIEIAKSTEAKAKTHKCGVCGLTASYSLNVHMRIHTKEQLFRCVFCEFSSNRRNSLNRHILRQHKVTNRPVPKTDQLKYYKCGVCDYHTSNENRLKDHVKIHKSDIFYRCFYCKFNTDIAESLSSHMVDNHSNKDKFYKCVYCPFNSNRVKLLKYHSLIHTNKEVHKCALCEFVSFSRKNLIDHLRVHYTGATYTCSKCDFSTTSRPALNYHYLDIHNKEDDKQSL